MTHVRYITRSHTTETVKGADLWLPRRKTPKNQNIIFSHHTFSNRVPHIRELDRKLKEENQDDKSYLVQYLYYSSEARPIPNHGWGNICADRLYLLPLDLMPLKELDDVIRERHFLDLLGCNSSQNQFHHPNGAWLDQVFRSRVRSFLPYALVCYFVGSSNKVFLHWLQNK